MIGLEAAKRNIKAYVRIQLPFYETSSKGSHEEKADIKPDGTIGIWWHESLRMLAAIEEYVYFTLRSTSIFLITFPSLNLVILRIGFAYGPYTNFGTSSLCSSFVMVIDSLLC